MSPPARWCRVCGGQVLDVENAWVDLPNLGRFWLCPSHFADATLVETAHTGYAYCGAGVWVILGPYPYEPVGGEPESLAEYNRRLYERLRDEPIL